METKRIQRYPGPDHPIAVEPAPGRIIVRFGDRVIADSSHALTMREDDYEPVHYIPRGDVDLSSLERTAHSSYCPYKGEASYYSISTSGNRSENAVWTYEMPYEAVSEIKEYVAFYADRVDAIELVT